MNDLEMLEYMELLAVFEASNRRLLPNKYANESYKLVQLSKDSSELGSCLINLGITEIHIDKYDSALKHFNQAIQIGKRV